MIILIAGITGNIGAHAAAHALSQGHTVRGLGRNPTKLPKKTADALENFVISSSTMTLLPLTAPLPASTR